MVSRLNDAILMRASWSSSAGTRWGRQPGLAGLYEDQYCTTLGKLSDGTHLLRALVRPQQEASTRCSSGAPQGTQPDIKLNHATHVGYTFEALLVAADAFKRAGSTDPKALAEAIRSTDIADA
jgi:branched-chain amino acid transport system substrate-binding protein